MATYYRKSSNCPETSQGTLENPYRRCDFFMHSLLSLISSSAFLSFALFFGRLPCQKVTEGRTQKKKTYNSYDSLIVTHPTTKQPISSLRMPERTGWPIFLSRWSYVIGAGHGRAHDGRVWLVCRTGLPEPRGQVKNRAPIPERNNWSFGLD